MKKWDNLKFWTSLIHCGYVIIFSCATLFSYLVILYLGFFFLFTNSLPFFWCLECPFKMYSYLWRDSNIIFSSIEDVYLVLSNINNYIEKQAVAYKRKNFCLFYIYFIVNLLVLYLRGRCCFEEMKFPGIWTVVGLRPGLR